jgi:hypothetical protein
LLPGDFGIAKNAGVINRIYASQTARVDGPSSRRAGVAILRESHRRDANDAEGSRDCKPDEILLSTHDILRVMPVVGYASCWIMRSLIQSGHGSFSSDE